MLWCALPAVRISSRGRAACGPQDGAEADAAAPWAGESPGPAARLLQQPLSGVDLKLRGGKAVVIVSPNTAEHISI